MSLPHLPRFAFFGTPRFAVRVLGALETQGLMPAVVITAPDKPRGRGLVSSAAPAKEWALERDIDVVTPEQLKDSNFITELANTEWDVFVVAAYGKLIPKNILEMPRVGALNVHPSLLPKFRGPSPVISAILADERVTGVTIMLMDERMDHGPIIAQGRIELEESAWPPQGSMFEDLLATEGGNLLAEALKPWLEKEITPVPQNEHEATYTKKFSDADARIDLKGEPYEQLLKIRAFDSNPRAHFFTQTPSGRDFRVLVTEADIENNMLRILRVIPEGKPEMDYETFLHSAARNDS